MTRSEPIPDFDLYRELEVDPSASSETIGAAYRSLAKRNHPDLGADTAAERMRRINVAHAWLIDPVRRARYDQTLPRADHGADDEEPGDVEEAVPVPQSAASAEDDAPPSPTVPTAMGLARYLLSSGVAVGIAYVASVLAAMVLADTGLPMLAGAVGGEDGTLSMLNLAGNLVFAGVMGYLVSTYALDLLAIRSRYGGVPKPMILVGTLAVMAFTFGFPAFSTSYLGGLGAWVVEAGAIGVVAIGALEVLFVAPVVLLAGWWSGGAWVAAMDRETSARVDDAVEAGKRAFRLDSERWT